MLHKDHTAKACERISALCADPAPWYTHLATLLEASVFERAYANRAGVEPSDLRDWGRFPEPCDCGEDMCEGWAMGFQWEDAIVEDVERNVRV